MFMNETYKKLRYDTLTQEQFKTPLASRLCLAMSIKIRHLKQVLNRCFQFILVHPFEHFPYA